MIKKSFKIYISLEHLSKINPEMRKILKIQKAFKRKKLDTISLRATSRSSVGFLSIFSDDDI